MSSALEIALISDECGWHCQNLIEALQQHDCIVTQLSLTQCEILLDTPTRICLPGFEDKLPHAVFVRGVPAGTLETVTLYLDILHALARSGVHVYNTAQMIERSVDKAMTSFLLQRVGIATPAAWAVSSYVRACEIVQRAGRAQRRLVLKPMFGSQGKDLQLISSVQDLPELGTDKVYYFQEFVKNTEHYDWRVFVVGDQVVAAMQRLGTSWVHNVAQGAECRFIDIDQPLASLAIAAVQAVGLFYGGVDLIRGSDGQIQVLEVNSIPAWKGLQAVAPVRIADYLVDHFLATRCINSSEGLGYDDERVGRR